MMPVLPFDVIGVDYSPRKVAVALLPRGGGPPRVFSYVTPKNITDNHERRMHLAAYYQSILTQLKNDGMWYVHLSIEAPLLGMSKNPQTLIYMAMVAGVLIHITEEELFIQKQHFVPPATWKKEVCGRGDLTKWEVGEWLRLSIPGAFSLCTSDDEVDAICLALYAAGVEGADAQE